MPGSQFKWNNLNYLVGVQNLKYRISYIHRHFTHTKTTITITNTSERFVRGSTLIKIITGCYYTPCPTRGLFSAHPLCSSGLVVPFVNSRTIKSRTKTNDETIGQGTGRCLSHEKLRKWTFVSVAKRDLTIGRLQRMHIFGRKAWSSGQELGVLCCWDWRIKIWVQVGVEEIKLQVVMCHVSVTLLIATGIEGILTFLRILPTFFWTLSVFVFHGACHMHNG